MKLQNQESVVYTFSSRNNPVAELAPGETVVVETADCFGGQVHSQEQSPETIDRTKINPVSGPFFITGAQPGDALEVEILDINLAGQGFMMVAPGMGRLGKLVKEPQLLVCELNGNSALFGPGVSLPLQPMLGVIGVAPDRGEVPSHTPGVHGGNLDTKEVKPGNSIHLPVFCPGALLGMGDVHAAMGDGELGGTGIEASAEVRFRVHLHKQANIPGPRVVSPQGVYLIHSASTLNRAIDAACKDAVDYVIAVAGLPADQAAMLVSACCDLQISQLVNPLVTVRIFVPHLS